MNVAQLLPLVHQALRDLEEISAMARRPTFSGAVSCAAMAQCWAVLKGLNRRLEQAKHDDYDPAYAELLGLIERLQAHDSTDDAAGLRRVPIEAFSRDQVTGLAKASELLSPTTKPQPQH